MGNSITFIPLQFSSQMKLIIFYYHYEINSCKFNVILLFNNKN